jgi:biopolymer transport protein TolR
MGMNVGPSSAGARPDINVTPLVDVVLVLLIIFMVVTPLLEKELPMRLPQIEEVKAEEPPPPDEQNIVLLVTAQDQIKYNGTVIQLGEIGEKLGPVLKTKVDGQDRVLFFAAEDDAKYELAIKVLDESRAAGARVIAYLTETPEGASGGQPGAPAVPGAPPAPGAPVPPGAPPKATPGVK